ncbi:MAG: uridine kinase [Polyangiaceae bacterium]
MVRPYFVGVAGGTGSGKTTVARAIASGMHERSATLIEHDAYYRDRPDLTYEQRCQLNFDHPDALETQLLIEHIGRLREGEGVELPIYDFATHRRSAERRAIDPHAIIVVEGILVFADERLRAQFDLKIFVDTDADIRVFRRIRRDIEQRGRTFASVREQYYSSVRPMHLQFVEPSKRWADVIVPEGGQNRVAIELILTKLRAEAHQRETES